MKKEYNKNIIVNGSMSNGKTKDVIFPLVDEMFKNKESLVILDTKEEYITNYYEIAKSNGYNTIILNLKDVLKSEGWNPLEYPYHLFKAGNQDRALEYVDLLAKTIYYEHSSNDPFWTNTTADFFTGVTLGLFEDAKDSEINLNSVNHVFSYADKKLGDKNYLNLYFENKDPKSSSYIFASTTFNAPVETKGGIISVAGQRIRLLAGREKLSALLSKTTFDYDDVITKPTVIFVLFNENMHNSILVSMFIEQLLYILEDKKTKNRFNFILDNFDSIEYINNLIELLSISVSKNRRYILGTRDMELLTDKYSKYILKECDVISVDNKNFKVENPEFIPEIDYPKLVNNNIELFDLEKYVDKKFKCRDIESKNCQDK